MDEFQDLSRTKMVSIGNSPQSQLHLLEFSTTPDGPPLLPWFKGTPDVLRGPERPQAPRHERFGNACYFFLFEHTSICIV